MLEMRNSPCLLLHRFIHALKSMWIIITVVLSLLLILSENNHIWIYIFIAYYVWTRVYHIFFDFLTIRYVFSDQEVKCERKFLSSSKQIIPWKYIASLSVSSDAIMQLCGCSTVVITPNGGAEESIRLHCIPNSYVRDIKIIASRYVINEPLERNQDSRPVQVANFIIGLRLLDCFLLAITKLYFFSFIPLTFAVIKFLFLDGSFFTDDYIQDWKFYSGLSLEVQIKVFLAVMCAAILVGTCLAWLRFSNACTSIKDETLVFHTGIIDKNTKRIPCNSLKTILIKKNMLMSLIGRQSIKVYGVSSVEEKRSAGVIAPLATDAQVELFLYAMKINIQVLRRFSGQIWPQIQVILLTLLSSVFLIRSNYTICLILFALAVSLWAWYSRWRFFTRDYSSNWIILKRGLFGSKILLINRIFLPSYLSLTVKGLERNFFTIFRISYLAFFRRHVFVFSPPTNARDANRYPGRIFDCDARA